MKEVLRNLLDMAAPGVALCLVGGALLLLGGCTLILVLKMLKGFWEMVW